MLYVIPTCYKTVHCTVSPKFTNGFGATCLLCFAQFTHLYEVPILNKKEDETLFKTGNSQKTTPSNASSSIYSLLNKLQNVNNTDTKFSLDVDRFSNDLRIHTMYAKNKGNNDDTANAKALASTSETSVGNVSFNSSISKYSDNVKKFSLDVDRFLND